MSTVSKKTGFIEYKSLLQCSSGGTAAHQHYIYTTLNQDVNKRKRALKDYSPLLYQVYCSSCAMFVLEHYMQEKIKTLVLLPWI